MNTNSALIIPAQSAPASNAAPLVFHDTVKPLIAIPNGWLWFFWIAAILALAAAIWWALRSKKAAVRPALPPLPPHVRARRRLEEALKLISEPKPFSVAVSDAIRGYLEERFDFRAPERTTEEFLYELQSTSLLTIEQKGSLADFLASCDLIKFAKYEPTETELRGLYEAALRLVNETEPKWTPSEPATASSAPATR